MANDKKILYSWSPESEKAPSEEMSKQEILSAIATSTGKDIDEVEEAVSDNIQQGVNYQELRKEADKLDELIDNNGDWTIDDLLRWGDEKEAEKESTPKEEEASLDKPTEDTPAETESEEVGNESDSEDEPDLDDNAITQMESLMEDIEKTEPSIKEEDTNAEETLVKEEQVNEAVTEAKAEDKPKKASTKKKKKKRKLKGWVQAVLYLVTVFAITFGLRGTRLFVANRVSGESMIPTYHDGEFLATTNVTPIDRYDVVTAINPEGTAIIKRVIGMPGDTVSWHNSHIYINGTLSDETFIATSTGIDLHLEGEVTLGEDEYFVAGDNREYSNDSRSWGVLPKANIIGEVIAHIGQPYKKKKSRYFPLFFFYALLIIRLVLVATLAQHLQVAVFGLSAS